MPLLALRGAVSTLHAQEFRASIIGHITDATDAAIPAAKTRIIGVDTKEFSGTYADGHGGFSFAFLSPGKYNLTAIERGFRTLDQSAIPLDSNETRDLSLKLEIGDVKNRVTVVTDAESIETTTASRTLDARPPVPLFHVLRIEPQPFAGENSARGGAVKVVAQHSAIK